MPATTSLQPATPIAGTCALAIGSAPLNEHLRCLLGSSHWNFDKAIDVRDAIERLKRNPAAAVLCAEANWREFKNTATGQLPRPPMVLVLTGRPNDAEWMEALAAGAYYVDTRNLNAAELFSLLNHAWHLWTRE